jgi:superfamily II DNA helicase RecQ
MAQRRPVTARELETVHGVGAAKLTRWGEEFLAVIRAAGEGESAGA